MGLPVKGCYNPERMSEPVIRASEIGEYVYCHRAWWLRRAKGQKTAAVRELQEGTKYHEQHGQKVWFAGWLHLLAYVLLTLVLLLLFYQLILRFAGG